MFSLSGLMPWNNEVASRLVVASNNQDSFKQQ